MAGSLLAPRSGVFLSGVFLSGALLSGALLPDEPLSLFDGPPACWANAGDMTAADPTNKANTITVLIVIL